MTHEAVLLTALFLIGLCALICAIDNVRNHNRLLRIERDLFGRSSRDIKNARPH